MVGYKIDQTQVSNLFNIPDSLRFQGCFKFIQPDFYIGAQAAVLNLNLITRDVSRYRSHFPTVKLITP